MISTMTTAIFASGNERKLSGAGSGEAKSGSTTHVVQTRSIGDSSPLSNISNIPFEIVEIIRALPTPEGYLTVPGEVVNTDKFYLFVSDIESKGGNFTADELINDFMSHWPNGFSEKLPDLLVFLNYQDNWQKVLDAFKSKLPNGYDKIEAALNEIKRRSEAIAAKEAGVGAGVVATTGASIGTSGGTPTPTDTLGDTSAKPSESEQKPVEEFDVEIVDKNTYSEQIGMVLDAIKNNPSDFIKGVFTAGVNTAFFGLPEAILEQFDISSAKSELNNSLAYLAGRVVGDIAGLVGAGASAAKMALNVIRMIKDGATIAVSAAGVGKILESLTLQGTEATVIAVGGAFVAIAGGNLPKDLSNLMDKVGGGSSGKGYLTPQQMNQYKQVILEGKDVEFETKQQALDFIKKKFSDFPEEVAGSRSAQGWHFDNHAVNGIENVEHVNIYSKDMGFRVHITWRS